MVDAPGMWPTPTLTTGHRVAKRQGETTMGMFARREDREVAGLRAEAESLQSRLASDVSTLDPETAPCAAKP